MAKPLWLLDVDGVINAIEPKPKHVEAWGEYRAFGAKAYSITYAPTLILGISQLMEDDLVDVHWLTTWQEDANLHLIAELGWPELVVASTREEYLSNERALGWWKLITAKRVAGDRPLIWTDDDLMDDGAQRWVRERSMLYPTLAICPSYRGGLQPNEFQMINDFCMEHKA